MPFRLIDYIYFRNVKMFHLNYLFILSVISRAQETTLTDEERGERLRKGFRLIKGMGLEPLRWRKFSNQKILEKLHILKFSSRIRVKEEQSELKHLYARVYKAYCLEMVKLPWTIIVRTIQEIIFNKTKKYLSSIF